MGSVRAALSSGWAVHTEYPAGLKAMSRKSLSLPVLPSPIRPLALMSDVLTGVLHAGEGPWSPLNEGREDALPRASTGGEISTYTLK